jgi:hypothetical protein
VRRWWRARRQRREAQAYYLVLDYLHNRAGQWCYALDMWHDLPLRLGRLYPALHGLEAGGVIEAEWEERDDDQPRRRRYRITDVLKARSVATYHWHLWRGVAR